VRNRHNPRSLLDTTRELAPEEMAELQLEQGYVERALAIYDELVQQHPKNAAYAMRREWLARLAQPKPRESSPYSELRVKVPEPDAAEDDPERVRRLPIVGVR
jgi:thioredoxin-like negative regulator of GroEL